MIRAFDYYAAKGDVDRALSVAEYPFHPKQGVTRQAQLLANALALAPPDSPRRGRLLSRYGIALGVEEGNYDDANAAFELALEIARQNGDEQLEVWTLANASDVDRFFLCRQDGLDKSLKAIGLARRLNEPAAELLAHFAATRVLYSLGDIDGAYFHAAAMLTLAERIHMQYMMVNAFALNQICAQLKGSWKEARAFSDQGLAIPPSDPWLLGLRVLLEYEVGDFSKGEAYMERLLSAMRLALPGPSVSYFVPAYVIPVVDRITDVARLFDIVKAAAASGLSSPSITPSRTLPFIAGLALIALRKGDVEGARRQYVALKSQRGTLIFGGTICVDRLLGLLARTMGELAAAVIHSEDAVAFCSKTGCRPELGWSDYDYAVTLLQRNSLSDHEKAMSLLDDALDISTDLGMHPLVGRVTDLKEKEESQISKVSAYPDGLTRREVEVLRLVTSGKSNREIAEELFITYNTAINHVKNILSKTGSANRTEAAAYAVGHGLKAQD